MTREAIVKDLVDMLSTYRRYRAELSYWAAQYNFPTDEKMRDHALPMMRISHADMLEELRSVHAIFDAKYEDTDDEDLAMEIDFEKVVKSVDKEASEIAEKMRTVNGIYIK